MAVVLIPDTNAGPHGPVHTPSELAPTFHLGKKIVGNRNPLLLRALPKAPPLLNNAIHPPTTRKALGKEAFNYRIIPRPPGVPSTDSMYPKQGYARHQNKGLAFGKMDRKCKKYIC